MKFCVLSKGELERIHETALFLLESVGMEVAGEEVKAVLKKIGAIEKDGRCCLKRELVESALERVPPEGFQITGRDGTRGCRIRYGVNNYRPAGGPPFVLDTDKKSRRPAQIQDTVTIARVVETLKHIGVANCAASPSDVGVGIQNVRRFAVTLIHSAKPLDITASGPDEVRTIAEIARLFRESDNDLIQRPLVVVYVSPTSPMRLSEQEGLATIECAKQGLPLAPLSCPSLAATAPIIPAAGLAQEWAEELFQIVLAYSIQPGLPVLACNRINPIDLQRGNTIFFGALPGLTSAVFAELAGIFHVPTNSWGFSSASHIPDLQAGAERMMGALFAALSGTAVISGAGALGNALITSAEQLIVDDEIAGIITDALSGVEVSESVLDGALLEEGIEEGTFLTSMQTVQWAKQKNIRAPEYFMVEPYEEWIHKGSDALDKAHARVLEIMSTPEESPLDPALIDDINQILVSAGAEAIERDN